MRKLLPASGVGTLCRFGVWLLRILIPLLALAPDPVEMAVGSPCWGLFSSSQRQTVGQSTQFILAAKGQAREALGWSPPVPPSPTSAPGIALGQHLSPELLSRRLLRRC